MAEHSVQVTFRLMSEWGSEAEIVAIAQLAEQLRMAIDEVGVGEFDGDEYGGHACRF